MRTRLLRRAAAPRAVVAALLLVALAMILPSMALAQSSEQRQLQEAKDRLDAISGEIEDAESEAAQAEEALQDADKRLQEVEAVVNEVAAAVERQEAAVAEAERTLEEVRQEAAEVAETFADRASRMFKQGANMEMEVLLNSEGAGDAFARTSYLRQVTEADSVSMETLEASETAVAAEQERLEAERDRLAEMQAEQEELLEQVQEIRESRAMAAAEAEEQVRLLEEEQDDLAADSEKLEDIIQAQAASGVSGSASTGASGASGYAWPMCAPVTSEYGPRWGRMHNGVDQGASSGTPIGASKGGTVISAGWQGGYGRMVMIDHGDGVVTAYAHMSSVSVGAGQSVSQGATIGAVGSTGNSTGPHLHFETRVNGSPVNPRQYLPGSPC